MGLKARLLMENDIEILPKGMPATEEWFEMHFPGALETSALSSWLPSVIAHPEVIETFSGLKWWFLEFDLTAPKLLLSDLPIHWEGGFENAEFMIQIPISPNRIFFGTRSEKKESVLAQMPPAEIIKRVNLTTLASSAGLIWASSRNEARAFIESHFDAWGTNVETLRSMAASRQWPGFQ